MKTVSSERIAAVPDDSDEEPNIVACLKIKTFQCAEERFCCLKARKGIT
jgi:hypothetical protein